MQCDVLVKTEERVHKLTFELALGRASERGVVFLFKTIPANTGVLAFSRGGTFFVGVDHKNSSLF